MFLPYGSRTKTTAVTLWMVFHPGIKSKSNLLSKKVTEVKKEAYCCNVQAMSLKNYLIVNYLGSGNFKTHQRWKKYYK